MNRWFACRGWRLHEPGPRLALCLERVRESSGRRIRLDPHPNLVGLHDRDCFVRNLVRPRGSYSGSTRPQNLRSHWRDARGTGVRPGQFHELPYLFVHRVRLHRRVGQRVRLRDPHPRRVEVVSRQARSCRWLDGRRVRGWIGHLWTDGQCAHRAGWLADHVPDPRCDSLLDVHAGYLAAEESSSWGTGQRDGVRSRHQPSARCGISQRERW